LLNGFPLEACPVARFFIVSRLRVKLMHFGEKDQLATCSKEKFKLYPRIPQILHTMNNCGTRPKAEDANC
jgi:hypothetical protein